MPKKFKVCDIQALLEHLSKETGESLDHYGLGVISDKMDEEVSHKYLYDNLFKAVERSEKPTDELNLSPNKIDAISRFVGYENFNEFVESRKESVDPVLGSLAGAYYSYVRKNALETSILQSPVKIYKVRNVVYFLLKGPRWIYKGELKYIDGCLFCLMKSDAIGKSFHHVYKIGKIKSPKVLMGIFSGVSSSNDPIGGRCVLIRKSEEFEELENCSISAEELNASDNADYNKLAQFFERFEDNNLRINIPYGFDFDDLV